MADVNRVYTGGAMNRLSYFWVALVLLCIFGREAAADPPLAAAPFDSDQAKALQKAWADHLGTPVQITNPLGMKLNLIPPGEFTMGSPKSEYHRSNNETWHLVRITKPFYLSVHEVTQQQYEKVMDKNPSKSKGTNKPVERVSWHDVVDFCSKLSEQESVEYRLPTEAEWEYACRAGTTGTYCFGNDASVLGAYAWYAGNYSDPTHPVGQKLPNAWGLFDMHGNVSEWCEDWYGPYKMVSDPTGAASGIRRVLRGGAFNYLPLYVRAADRDNRRPGFRLPYIGFRMARTYPSSP